MLDDCSLICDLIAPAVGHLHSLGIEPELTLSPLVHADQLDAFNAEFGIVLPEQVRDIYGESDGLSFDWRCGDDWGAFHFPSLYELRLHRQRWINGEMPDKRSTSHLDDDIASNVLANMELWLPIDESGGGDLLCVDCSNGRVVEFDHEWSNATKRNGTIYSDDLHTYIRNRARLSFVDIWLAAPSHMLRDDSCWIDWSLHRVPQKYVVGDSNAS